MDDAKVDLLLPAYHEYNEAKSKVNIKYMIKNLLKEEYERAEQMRDYWGQVAEGTIARKIFAAKHGNK